MITEIVLLVVAVIILTITELRFGLWLSHREALRNNDPAAAILIWTQRRSWSMAVWAIFFSALFGVPIFMFLHDLGLNLFIGVPFVAMIGPVAMISVLSIMLANNWLFGYWNEKAILEAHDE